jgi:hypothetical protein
VRQSLRMSLFPLMPLNVHIIFQDLEIILKFEFKIKKKEFIKYGYCF